MSHTLDRSTMTRRYFLSLSAATAAAGLLAACSTVAPPAASQQGGGAAAPALEKAVVNHMSFPLTADDVELFRPIQAAFQEAHPEITVNVQIDPWTGRQEKMLAAIAAGNPPDAVYLNPDFYPKFVEAKSVMPIDDYLDANALDDFLAGPMDAVTYDGSTYGLPILTSAFTQAYNMQLIEEAGIAELPTTWEEFYAAVETVHNPDSGVWGAFYGLNRPSPVTTFVPFLRMAGGEQFTPDGSDIAFDGPEGLEALEYLTSFYRNGLVQQSNINGGGLPFSSGQIGFMIQTQNNEIKAAMQDNPDLRIGITPTLKHVEQSNFGTVGSYAIFSLSKYPQATTTWLSTLTNRENTLTILRASGFISPRASIAPQEYAEGVFAEVAAQAQYMRPEPKHVKAREVMSAQQPEFEAAYLGSKSVQEALQAAADAARQLLAS